MTAPELRSLPIDRLHASPRNPRQDIGDIGELAETIGRLGVLEPLIVTGTGNGWEVVAGHRRLAAATKAGLAEVPCIIRDGLDDRERLELAIVENLQRTDLTPLEEADAYAELVRLGVKQKDLAAKVGRSEGHVSKRLSVGKLPPLARQAVDAGELLMEDALEATKLPAKTVEQMAHEGHLNRGWIRHEVARHSDAQKRKVVVDRLTAEGVRIEIASRGEQDIGKSYGVHVELEAHRDEPCHAATVGTTGAITWICLDPARHRRGGKSKLKEIKPEPEQERPDPVADARRALKADRDAASDRRTAFVQALLAKPTPDEALPFVVTVFANLDEIWNLAGLAVAVLQLPEDTYNKLGDEARLSAFGAKGSKNAAKALHAMGLVLAEQMAQPSAYSSDLNEEELAIVRPYLEHLWANGYERHPVELALIGEEDVGALDALRAEIHRLADRLDGLGGQCDLTDVQLAGAELSELEALHGELLAAIEESEAEADPDGDHHTWDVKGRGRVWRWSCSCGEGGRNTTKAYAEEAGRVHAASVQERAEVSV